MDELVAHHGVRRALSAADLETAHKTGQPAIIGDVEGLDFLPAAITCAFFVLRSVERPFETNSASLSHRR
jgi:hypothetical protein